jgi:hypothetical protein
MRAWIVLLPSLLGACNTAWPPGSYATVSYTDAKTLAPAIADYLSAALPPRSIIALAPAQGDADQIAPALILDLDRVGIKQAPGGTPIRYVADEMDGGIILRISIADRQGASRYFTRSEGDGSLVAAGPLTVAQP